MGFFSKEKTKLVASAEIHGAIAVLGNKKTLNSKDMGLLWIEENGLQVTLQGRTFLIPQTTVAIVEFQNENKE